MLQNDMSNLRNLLFRGRTLWQLRLGGRNSSVQMSYRKYVGEGSFSLRKGSPVHNAVLTRVLFCNPIVSADCWQLLLTCWYVMSSLYILVQRFCWVLIGVSCMNPRNAACPFGFVLKPSESGYPENKKPRAFHHDGRRATLFYSAYAVMARVESAECL